MENTITIFSISLTMFGTILAIISLIFSIIFLIKNLKLEKEVEKIEEERNAVQTQLQEFEQISDILIDATCCTFSDDGEMTRGKESVELVMKERNCNKIEAVKIIKNLRR